MQAFRGKNAIEPITTHKANSFLVHMNNHPFYCFLRHGLPPNTLTNLWDLFKQLPQLFLSLSYKVVTYP